jgi:hypothetical protein
LQLYCVRSRVQQCCFCCFRISFGDLRCFQRSRCLPLCFSQMLCFQHCCLRRLICSFLRRRCLLFGLHPLGTDLQQHRQRSVRMLRVVKYGVDILVCHALSFQPLH